MIEISLSEAQVALFAIEEYRWHKSAWGERDDAALSLITKLKEYIHQQGGKEDLPDGNDDAFIKEFLGRINEPGTTNRSVEEIQTTGQSTDEAGNS